MNKIKKILLAAFSLSLIVSINQAIAADFNFSEEPQQIIDARAMLKSKSDNLVAKYHESKYFELRLLISKVNSNVNTIRYAEVMQYDFVLLSEDFLQITAVSAEEKEQAINERIRILDKKINGFQTALDFLVKDSDPSAITPDDVKDFFHSSFELSIGIFKLGKQQLEAQLSKVKESSAIKQEL